MQKTREALWRHTFHHQHSTNTWLKTHKVTSSPLMFKSCLATTTSTTTSTTTHSFRPQQQQPHHGFSFKSYHSTPSPTTATTTTAIPTPTNNMTPTTTTTTTTTDHHNTNHSKQQDGSNNNNNKHSKKRRRRRIILALTASLSFLTGLLASSDSLWPSSHNNNNNNNNNSSEEQNSKFQDLIKQYRHMIQGLIRMIRTIFTCMQVGVSYKYHMSSDSSSSPSMFYYIKYLSSFFSSGGVGVGGVGGVGGVVKQWETDVEYQRMVHALNANRFLKLFETNGCVYIKVGQYISSLKHLLDDEYIRIMSVLQDQAPFVNYEQVERVLWEEFGKYPVKRHEDDDNGDDADSYLFQEFEKVPIAAASIAQVHRARLKNGREVAVKIQYPKTREYFEIDMMTHAIIVWGLVKFFPGHKFDFLQEEMAKYLRTELDFKQEAENSRRAAYHFRHRKDVHIPEVIPELSSDRVLTMEFIHGIKINNVKAMQAAGISVKKTAHLLFDAMSDQIYLHGYLHSDPHAGNLFIRKDERGKEQLVILDHGLYKELDEKFRENYSRLYKALVLRDEPNIQRYCGELGIVDWKLFSVLILMRAYDGAVVGMSNGVKASEKEAFSLRMKNEMDQMLDVLRRLPKDMLMILRSNNLLRSINHELGVPVNRFAIFARKAAQGIHSDDATQREGVKRTLSQNVKSMFLSVLSWKEKVSFEWNLFRYQVLYFWVDVWFRIQIALGYASEITEEELMEAG